MTWDNIVRAISAAIGSLLGFLFGELDGFFYALLSFMAIDYISGVLIAIINKKLSSEIGFKGLVKKIFMLMLVAVGHLIDAQVIGSGAAVMVGVEFVFIANEGISILENAAKLGVPIPKKLKNILIQLKNDDDKGGGVDG